MISRLIRTYRRLAGDVHFSEILTGSVFSIGAQVASVGLAMVTSIIVARHYGAKAVGVLAVINSFLTLVTILTVLGTKISIMRLIPEHIAKFSVASAFRVYRKTEYLVIGTSLAAGLVFYFASGLVADRVFSKPYLAGLFGLAAGFVVFRGLMQLNTNAVRGLRLIRTFAFMQALPALAFVVVLVGFALLRSGTNDPVYAQLAAYAITAIVGSWIMDRAFHHRMRPDDVVQAMPLGEILSISLPMLMSASMQFFIGQAGIVMLGMFRSEAEVGYYAIAVRLSMLTGFVLKAINSMAASKFSELYHTDELSQLFRVAKRATKLIFWSTVPILLTLLILGRPILGLLYGSGYRVAYGALALLVMGQFVSSASGSTGVFMNMTGAEKAMGNIMAVAAVSNVVMNALLIPRFGIEGAAFAGMVTFCIWNLSSLVYIKRKYGKTIGYLPGLG